MLLKKHFLEFSFESGFCGYDYPCMFDVNLLIKLKNLREALAQQNLDYSSRIYNANNWYMLIANDVANVVGTMLLPADYFVFSTSENMSI